MLRKCRQAVDFAAKAAGRAIPTQAQYQAIEDQISRQMRRLAGEEPERWQTLTRDQQMQEAASAAIADIKAAADRKLENAQRQVIKVAETDERLRLLQGLPARQEFGPSATKDEQTARLVDVRKRRSVIASLMECIA